MFKSIERLLCTAFLVYILQVSSTLERFNLKGLGLKDKNALETVEDTNPGTISNKITKVDSLVLKQIVLFTSKIALEDPGSKT